MTIECGEKVWGGLTSHRTKPQVRTIVVARSQKAAAALVGVTLHEFSTYWCRTSNEDELRVASISEGKVFKASSAFAKDFKRVA